MPKPRTLQTTFSTYELGSQIGQGGSGHVFRARDEDGDEVAIKVLDSSGTSRRNLKRFKNEVRFGTRTEHDNVVRVIDHGVSIEEESPTPFLVMPLYEGSLRTIMKRGISSNDVLPLFSMILNGVEAAHAHNVIHRDIKPENVLYAHIPDGEIILVVADFGIARFTEEELYTAAETRSTDRLANFQYASPEQRVRGRDVDERSDIYSLGLLLNEMFTGEIPSGTDYKTAGADSSDFIFVDSIIDRMIRQNPADRYSSISDIRREIRVRSEQVLSVETLTRLKTLEIESGELHDPILASPIKIVDGDWSDGVLTLVFQQEVNDRWVNALRNMGSYESLMGASPEYFRFTGNTASVAVRHNDAQRVIDFFKRWLPKVHNVYKEKLRREIAAEEAQKKKELDDRISREELNAKTREELRF